MNASISNFSPFHAGCSALSWETQDHKHLLGRNYDFSRLAQGSQVVYLPKNTEYYTCGSPMEHNAQPEHRRTSSYACGGMGLLIPSNPILYEGINEMGLMGGQLYYREFACYPEVPRPGTVPLQPPFLVYHLLSQCATVDEAAAMLEEDTSLVALPFMGTVPPLHWAFSDRTGETMIIEPDQDGLHIYRRSLGVMTNSPGYSWHRLNLLNYAGIRDLDYAELDMGSETLSQCFSGSGAQGLPGDWSSPSRFVRLAFLKKLGVKGADEASGVANLFHLLQSAAFPLGMVRVTHQGHITDLDQGVSPYDYTVYTSVMCAESLRFYWTSYENQRVQYIDLHHLSKTNQPAAFELDRAPDFLCRSQP